MARDRTRIPLESGLRLDLAHLISSGTGKPGAYIFARMANHSLEATAHLGKWKGDLTIQCDAVTQNIMLRPSPRHLGGAQWYAVCPVTGKRARVLWKPRGASIFASRHAWRGQV